MKSSESGMPTDSQKQREQAQGALLFEHVDRVYRWAVLLGLTPAEAQDAAQDVLAIALRRFRTCPAPEAVPAWLFQITRRVVANARRRGWWRMLVPLHAVEEPAFQHAPGRDVDQELAVRACLKNLSLLQREVLILVEIEGHTREEVAHMLAISPGTVASRLRLAREAFRRHWVLLEPNVPVTLSWSEP